MAEVSVLDESGKKLRTRKLSDEVFAASVQVPLLHQVVVAGLAGVRAGTQSTKTRGDVSGGGKKPWRQKGTGRARQGSIRSPQWTGGGVAHGPKPRSYEIRVNKKMKRGALRGALTDALETGKLVVVDHISFDRPKTKRGAALLDALELAGRVLIVLPEPTDSGAVEKSFRNMTRVRVAYAGGLGVSEVLAANKVVVTEAALDVLEGQSGRDETTRGKGRKAEEDQTRNESPASPDMSGGGRSEEETA